MDRGTMIAIALAPVVVPVVWWALTRPGKALHNWLWKRLPEGRLRRILLGKVSDNWLPHGVKDPNP